MEQLLKQYKEQTPEIVFEWSDAETEAKGWVVINSLRGGAAGGGTRMRKGLNKEEVISLAKVMEVKFSVCGPNIGGAKSGINFDPNDPRREEVLKRWYKAVIPLLKNYYGTGGDLNVDELKDVIPITQDLGLWHPQEGIVNGHLQPTGGERIAALGQLRLGVSKIIEDPNYIPETEEKLAIADMVTGYGVAEAVLHYYDLYHGESVKDKKVIIQGWGNVASAAAFYFAKNGAKIVGIIDVAGGIIAPEGLSYEEVVNLFLNKKGNKLQSEQLIPFEEAQQAIWDVPADIFIPGAASKLVTAEQVQRLQKGGLKVMSCGANVPFVDDQVFFGPTAKQTDEELSLIPDFIANCGMARVFAYLMKSREALTDAAIFEDISWTIRQALEEVKARNNSPYQLSTTALTLALEKLT
ncbi:Glu/Leu/Phe/Val dehydrogenase dimerization domain-containing protein [Saprospira sp. CCB-QB6]|uniref:Glu/Leu/Phe/Val dehydrogenase dimerization domain-containing protein n=1 Tax=Saprospira sp. CCB-QB6 TaxID=3023936 RepID=UPI00234A5071|nr:Glu/Leu/Phe/Val dehydrogenase dimerization domain-containing protein [Saprospira sp. CCB-QB6]WCL82967.1 Glu/Leu/Phe/Val dehydrogenase dimerization domain-containing protein [Saprospira sp. CCB-QB6]